MKKSLVVLLIVVLAVGSAFAAVTGSASFSAGFDLGKKTFTFNNAKSGNGTFKLEWAADTGATAESDKIAAKFSGKYTATMSQDGLKNDVKVDDLIIYKADNLWSLNLTKIANGIEFVYDGYTLDAAYEKKNNWSVSAATKTYELAEGLTIGGSVGYKSAINDLTDAANWTYGYKADVQKAHDKAYKEFFAMCDDGIHYKTQTAINDAIDAVTAAEEALGDAKDAFAADPSKANLDAIDDAVDAIADAKADLADAIADAEKAFKKANSGTGKWYTAKETKGYKNDTWAEADEDPGTKGSLYKGTKYLVEEVVLVDNSKETTDKTYYIVGDTAVEESKYDPKGGKVKYVTTVEAGKKVWAYCYRESTTTTTYSENKKLYDFLPTIGTQTLTGNLNVAYTADDYSAKADLNAAYEFIAKELSYDATLSGNYKFVTAKVAYDSDKILGAEASAKLDDIVGLPLSIKVAASDILTQGDDGFVLSGEATATIDAFTVGAKGLYDFDGRKGKSNWEGSLDASYKMDVATFKAAATLYEEKTLSKTTHNFDGSVLVVKPSISASTTSVIDNATLTLDWSGAQFNGADASNGAVTAKIEVKF